MKSRTLQMSVILCLGALSITANGYSYLHSDKYWIFFTDKGSEEFCRDLMKGSAPSAHLSRRAVARRKKVAAVIDQRDLPLYQPYLDTLRGRGIVPVVTSRWLNAISAYLTEEQVRRLEELAFVRVVEPVATARKRPDPTQKLSLPADSPGKITDSNLDYGPSATQNELIHVPAVHNLGINATDVCIGMLDTGYQYRTHEAFRNISILAEYDFINDDSITYNESGQDVTGQHNHGTYTLSAIGGHKPGQLIGPAYGAEFLLAKTEDESSETPIEEDYWVAGIEWEEARGADVVSSSVGYFDWYQYKDMNGDRAVTTIAADIAVQKGVVVVNSAGNEGAGTWRYIIAPADGDSVIAVGSVTGSGVLVPTSSRGPTFDGRIKPDVVAMGSSVYAAGPLDTTDYRLVGGTSLSCPQVAGVAALILSAHPYLTPAEVRQAIRETANNALHPNNDYGWGLVDAWRAVLYHGAAFSNRPSVKVASDGDYEITISVASDPEIDTGEVKLFWSVDSNDISTIEHMEVAAVPHRYISRIPYYTPGTPIYCYFTAQNTAPTLYYHPYNAGDSVAFFYFAAGDTTVYSSYNDHNAIIPPVPPVPDTFVLYNLYPNPLAPGGREYATIKFDLPEPGRVTLKIFNVLGQEVSSLLDDVLLPARTHYYNWRGRDDYGASLPSGIYFCRLSGPGMLKVQKIIMTK